jgi:hypothetical protein
MMTIDAFRDSISNAGPSADLPPALNALWWARKGDWAQAHRLVQQHEGDPDCDLVHAHLHRQEGDMANAGGWYRRVDRTLPTLSLTEEWNAIASELLARG